MKANKKKCENPDLEGETKRVASRDLREPAVYAGLSTPRAFVDFSLPQLTVVCAEPGMGKTFLANRLANNASKRGRSVYRYEYQNKGINVFIDSLNRLRWDNRLQKNVLAFVMVQYLLERILKI